MPGGEAQQHLDVLRTDAGDATPTSMRRSIGKRFPHERVAWWHPQHPIMAVNLASFRRGIPLTASVRAIPT